MNEKIENNISQNNNSIECIEKSIHLSFHLSQMNRGRPKRHIKAFYFKYVNEDGTVDVYTMGDLKSNQREKDIEVKIKVPNLQNEKQGKRENEEHFYNQEEINKPMTSKLQEALKVYNGDLKELYFDAFGCMNNKYPRLLNCFLRQNEIMKKETKSEENNIFSQTKQLNLSENEIRNQTSFHNKYFEQDQIPKSSYQSLSDFEEITNRTKELDLLKLELNNSPPEYQDIENPNAFFDFQNLYF